VKLLNANFFNKYIYLIYIFLYGVIIEFVFTMTHFRGYFSKDLSGLVRAGELFNILYMVAEVMYKFVEKTVTDIHI
jgi:hypothetical protein